MSEIGDKMRQFDLLSFFCGLMFGAFFVAIGASMAYKLEDDRIHMMRKYIQIERLQGEIVELAK